MIVDDVTAPTEADADARQEIMIANVIAATGLSREIVTGLMVSDDELDDMCDAALAGIAPT
jgi:hypothetical protein